MSVIIAACLGVIGTSIAAWVAWLLKRRKELRIKCKASSDMCVCGVETKDSQDIERITAEMEETKFINKQLEEEIRHLGMDVLDKATTVRRMKDKIDDLQDLHTEMRRLQIQNSPGASMH